MVFSIAVVRDYEIAIHLRPSQGCRSNSSKEVVSILILSQLLRQLYNPNVTTADENKMYFDLSSSAGTEVGIANSFFGFIVRGRL